MQFSPAGSSELCPCSPLRCYATHHPPPLPCLQTVRCPPGSVAPTRALRDRAGGLGRAGKATAVQANHFKMSLKASQAFHYDVSIDRLLSEEETAKQAARKPRRDGEAGREGGREGGAVPGGQAI